MYMKSQDISIFWGGGKNNMGGKSFLQGGRSGGVFYSYIVSMRTPQIGGGGG